MTNGENTGRKTKVGLSIGLLILMQVFLDPFMEYGILAQQTGSGSLTGQKQSIQQQLGRPDPKAKQPSPKTSIQPKRGWPAPKVEQPSGKPNVQPQFGWPSPTVEQPSRKPEIMVDPCPKSSRLATKQGLTDAMAFSRTHPLSTWTTFLNKFRGTYGSCSPFVKKSYLEAARKVLEIPSKPRFQK